MKIYNYDRETKEFLGSSDARISPLDEKVFLIPANATETKPPIEPLNKKALFDGNEWLLVDDFRGTRYWLFNNFGIEITELNITVPVAATIIPPPNFDFILSGGNWRALNASEIATGKDIQVEAELGTNMIRILIETLIPAIQDGSITTMSPTAFINLAKAKRKAEL